MEQCIFHGDSSKTLNSIFSGTDYDNSYITSFIRIFDGNYGENFSSPVRYITRYYYWTSSERIALCENGDLYNISATGTVTLLDSSVTRIHAGVATGVIYEKDVSGTKTFMLLASQVQGWYKSFDSSYRALQWYDVTNIFKNSFDLNNIKDFCIQGISNSKRALLILTNDGKLYGTGDVRCLGVNSNVGYSDAFIDLTSTCGLELIESFICNNKIGYYDNGTGFTLLKGKSGKMYGTYMKSLLYRDSMLQKSWAKINPEGVKVSKFNARISGNNGSGFVDSNNDLWVTGYDVTELGINHSQDDLDLNNFVRLKDYIKDSEVYSHIDGNIIDYRFSASCLFILTNEEDNYSLYVCGLDAFYNGLGHDAFVPTLLFENVLNFDVYVHSGRMVCLRSGELYIWRKQ